MDRHPGGAFPSLASYWLRRTGQDVLYLSGGHSAAGCDPAILERCQRELETLAERGARIRMLCHPDSIHLPSHRDFTRRLINRGARVRISTAVQYGTAVFDGRCALVWRGALNASHPYVLIHTPDLVGPVAGLAEGIWTSAVGLNDVERHLAGELGSDQISEVLTLLAQGHKDEVAARMLGVSLRTYRRQVAVAMRRLGARSRFEAGARATSLGLVAGTPPDA
ncbi:helix-turn-helix transcriptional regulator [Plantactinospora sp. KBS50]|uniref:helix-turn-helix transcriptional regulator n=1 Tax=Plantactinospora sp. KBS50 TaxID=2024580 RepID=UPI000BAAA4C3|nr:helix-turn-helix transcriptional regulator [Plantactinospora sp. KBS50]ASW53299.1 hypothetical protein CIK06_02525 [Plantactinospora sp. KBS50]